MFKEDLLCFSIGIFIIFMISVILFILPNLLNKINLTTKAETLSSYECGFQSFDHIYKEKFYIHFFLVSVIFLIFDLEILYLIPLIDTTFISLLDYFISIGFFSILTLGYIFDYKFGAIRFIINTTTTSQLAK
jgi:NADH-quinone oxidoreductase subunit A